MLYNIIDTFFEDNKDPKTHKTKPHASKKFKLRYIKLRLTGVEW